MMAVEACSSPNLKDDMEEDDEAPLVFKRSGSSSKQSHFQLSADRKKLSLSSQKHGTQSASAMSISGARPANGESSNSQNDRMGIQAKASPTKSPLSSAKASSSPAKGPLIKSSTTNSKPSGPSIDKARQLSPHKSSNSVEEAKPDKAKQLNPQKSSNTVEEAKPEKAKQLNSQKSSNRVAEAKTDKAKQLNSQKSSNSVAEAKADKEKQLCAQKSSNSVEEAEPSNNVEEAEPSNNVEEAKSSVHCAAETKSDSEDSDDEKPLRSRVPVGLSRGNSSHSNKETHESILVQQPSIKEEDESDDEKSLSLRLLVKSNNGESKCEPDDSDDDKPLAAKRVQNGSAPRDAPVDKSSTLANKRSPGVVKSKCEPDDSDDAKPLAAKRVQNGSAPRDGPVNKSSTLANKRSPDVVKAKCEPDDSDDNKPLAAKRVHNGSALRVGPVDKSSTLANKRSPGVVKSSSQPPIKKAKLSGTGTPSDGKKAPIKAETKTEDEDDDDDDVPISQKIKKPPSSVSASSSVKKVTKVVSSSLRKTNVKSKKITKKTNYSKSSSMLPGSGEGKKWTNLEHNGVIFPPPYKPHGVKMLYKKQPVDLTPEQEEVATMIAVMLDTEYMTKPRFKENFFNDWKKILGKNHVIQNLEDCDFTPIYEWHQSEKEKKKQMTTEEKKALKEEKLILEEKYMWAKVDGMKEKVGNFRVEPPGLFRGRGEHPKMGKLKKRIRPCDITINIGKEALVPECPIPGERWKEVRHDDTVTWLAYWNDPINPKEFKYVFLAASSTLKGQSDKEKYEKARKLKDYIQDIRKVYTKDFTSKDSTKKQIAVATYLIDKLALRAGNEKDDDEADTVGCCTLKVENVEPVPPTTLKFDFLGKDSIRYENEVTVERPVFEAIQQFRKGKKGSDDLFDELDTAKLNTHLKELMPGLTAKVFRTYNASITLDDMLCKDTRGADVNEKVVVYQHANKEVAIICNHQRTESKSHSTQISKLNEKIAELKALVEELEVDLSRVKKGKPPSKSPDGKAKKNLSTEKLEIKIAQTNAKIEKMERDKDTKEDLKTVALGTSKINYLDPRITVAWCKRHEVPIEKIFNKSLLAKFAWAMDVDPCFRF